jgi:hypothetical protein
MQQTKYFGLSMFFDYSCLLSIISPDSWEFTELPMSLIWCLVQCTCLVVWNMIVYPCRMKFYLWRWFHISPIPFSILHFWFEVLGEETFLSTYYIHDMITCHCQHFGWFHFIFIFSFFILHELIQFHFIVKSAYFFFLTGQLKEFVRCICFEFSHLPNVTLHFIFVVYAHRC